MKRINDFKYLILVLILFGTSTATISCKPGLMSYTKFQQQAYELPKILELSKPPKELLYFGTYHINNPRDSIITKIESNITRFKPDYLLHEGGDNWPIYGSKDSTVMVSGEAGLTIYYGLKNCIPYASIEPPISDEYEYLLRSFDRSNVILMYLCRQVDQQKRMHASNAITDLEFKRNMEVFLAMINEKGLPLHPKELKWAFWSSYYNEFIGEELKWQEFDPSLFYPNAFKTKLNDINRASDSFRNEYMITTIFETLKEFDKVMVVVGGGHLIVQEQMIRHNFKRIR